MMLKQCVLYSSSLNQRFACVLRGSCRWNRILQNGMPPQETGLSLFSRRCLSMFFIKRSLSAEPNKASSFLICQVHGSYSFLSSSQFLFFAEFPHRIEVFEHSLSEKYLINMHIHMHGNFRIQCVYGTILWLLFYDPAKAGSYRLVQMFITIV